MRKLALDLGSKRIGVAVSDPLNITAQPLGYVRRSDIGSELEQIKKFVDDFEVDEIIVGLPLELEGTFGKAAKKASVYADLLQDEIKIPVTKWDERMTTRQAEHVLIEADISRKKRKEIVDSLAAVIILQNYLNAKR